MSYHRAYSFDVELKFGHEQVISHLQRLENENNEASENHKKLSRRNASTTKHNSGSPPVVEWSFLPLFLDCRFCSPYFNLLASSPSDNIEGFGLCFAKCELDC